MKTLTKLERALELKRAAQQSNASKFTFDIKFGGHNGEVTTYNNDRAETIIRNLRNVSIEN